ncbi:glycosyltransferase [Paenibacillus alvei]|uniref:glycosyltransferase n=1 Tax=Paenibacillus alvei TaxID=44250 RepID=UPI00227E7EEA|nr:glycosyltransferase [Paenibacillus alvei]
MFHASIVIPTFNRSKLLEYTIKSLLKQNASPYMYEIIIVDDGSTDETQQMVQKYMENNHIVYFFQDKKGYRVSSARNTGINNARGNTIIFLDSGMLVGSNFVYEHCRAHDSRATDTVIIGYIHGFQANEEDHTFIELVDFNDIDHTLQRIKESGLYQDLREAGFTFFQDHIQNSDAPWYYFWTGNVSVQKNVLQKHGGFNEAYNTYGMEDQELGFLLYDNGLDFELHRAAEAIHYPHETFAKADKKASGEKNAFKFHKKYNRLITEQFYLSLNRKFNEELYDLKQKGDTRINYNTSYFDKFFKSSFCENNGRAILFGGHNGALLNFLQFGYVLEYHQPYFEELKRNHLDRSVYQLMGGITPFPDKYFEYVFITDYWNCVDTKWLPKIMKEAVRIANVVHIITEIIYNNSYVFSPQKNKQLDLLEALRSYNLSPHLCQKQNGELEMTYLELRS